MRRTFRDQVLLLCAALATAMLLAGGAHRLMRFAVPDSGVGMMLLVRR